MQQRPPRAVDHGRPFLEFKLSYVSFTQVELNPLFDCTESSLREHPRRRVNPDYTLARCLSDRDRNAPCPNGKLDQRPVSLGGKPNVERHVSMDGRRQVLVPIRPGVVPTRHGNSNLRANETAFGRVSVLSPDSFSRTHCGPRGPLSKSYRATGTTTEPAALSCHVWFSPSHSIHR